MQIASACSRRIVIATTTMRTILRKIHQHYSTSIHGKLRSYSVVGGSGYYIHKDDEVAVRICRLRLKSVETDAKKDTQAAGWPLVKPKTLPPASATPFSLALCRLRVKLQTFPIVCSSTSSHTHLTSLSISCYSVIAVQPPAVHIHLGFYSSPELPCLAAQSFPTQPAHPQSWRFASLSIPISPVNNTTDALSPPHTTVTPFQGIEIHF
jgi:hypothetical protein